MNIWKTTLLLVLLFTGITVHAQKVKKSLNSDGNLTIWKVKAQAEIEHPSDMMTTRYDTRDWVKATVPGTVFGSYVLEGLEPDPNFADNAYKVDKAKYDRNFWYRTEFNSPEVENGERVWLNFEGVNRKGEIFFNGTRLGLLDGFMHRGNFDITDLLSKNGKNVLAVLVHWVGTPVPNYASPTYMSCAGWDWMPYVPGLLTGITDDVYLTKTGEVSIVDPWIRSKVPSKNKAVLSLQLELRNHTDIEQKGVLKGIIQPGNIEFTEDLVIEAGKQRTFLLDDSKFSQFIIRNPALWWPNGYGQPNLYTCELTYMVNGKASDKQNITFGIREYGSELVDGVLHLKINGEPVYVKGGNWGMSEYMLRCRGEEYDLKLKLHNEMHFNMIRNWIGSVTDDEFYEACDKYGIMVWDDFWLNSNSNLPDDVFAFNMNAVEKIKRLRNHACIAVWCGDNEGYPLPPLNKWLEEDVRTYDGGDRAYHANSHSDGLSGSGPWTNSHPNWYFTKAPYGYGANITKGWGFRTEIGTAVFTTFDSFKKFMPEKDWWPRNEMWDKHFFGNSAGNASPDKYFSTVEFNYGKAKGIEDFCRKAQLVNVEVNKAMYEGFQHHIWEDASGILTWMGQSAYPSLVWQTYDYYYDLTGAYWGIRKACEPVHIQWSYADNSVKVINTTLKEQKGLTATGKVYNLDGKEMGRYSQSVVLDAAANKDSYCFHLNFTTDNLAFGKKAVASSISADAGEPSAAIDASDGSRWASEPRDEEWIYVDLGEPTEIASVILNWEAAHAKAYKLLISDDAINWKEIYINEDSKGGVEEIKIKPVRTRYVKMQGLKQATMWGYSLYEFELYGRKKKPTDLTPVHFIKLELNDENGQLLSDNFYWRSNKPGDYKALNNLPKAKLRTTSSLVDSNGKKVIKAKIENVGSSVAFAVHVQAIRSSDGERILPALMNDNYFTLLKGESKDIEIEFDSDLLPDGNYSLSVIPYNK